MHFLGAQRGGSAGCQGHLIGGVALLRLGVSSHARLQVWKVAVGSEGLATAVSSREKQDQDQQDFFSSRGPRHRGGSQELITTWLYIINQEEKF